MKKWHKRTLVILFLGALGTVAIGLRPAWQQDEVKVIHPFSTVCDLPLHLQNSNFSFTHSISLLAPQRGSWFDTQSRGIEAQIQGGNWDIRVVCKDGKLTVLAPPAELSAADGHLRVVSFAGIGEAREVRTPNGNIHTEYLMHVSCYAEYTPSFWREPQRSYWVQFITIDVEDESADMGTPLWAPPNADFLRRFRMSTNGPDAMLPARYCNAPLENAMLRLTRTLAACTEETHAAYTPTLISGAEQMCRFATDSPWPDCWGAHAQTARDLSYRLGPTLVYLQQNACFGNADLADFINSENFARIFGKDFSEARNPEIDVDLRAIDIERINTQ